MFRHAWLALLFFFASLPALGAPSVTIGPGAKSGQATVIIATDDTSDSKAIPTDGVCSARVVIAGSDVVELWGVNSPATAATSGTQIGADFTTSTPPTVPYTWTAGTTHVKVKGTTATTGGSVVIIDCNPLMSLGGGAGNTYSVTSYGAVANGTTNDVAAINRAIDAACDAGGGIVYFPPGTYAVGSTGANVFYSGIQVTCSNVLLLGVPFVSEIVPLFTHGGSMLNICPAFTNTPAYGTNENCAAVANIENVRIEGLYFNDPDARDTCNGYSAAAGTCTSEESHAIYVNECDDCIVHANKIEGIGDEGINFSSYSGGGGVVSSNLVINTPSIRGSAGSSIEVEGQNILVINNTVQDISADPFADAGNCTTLCDNRGTGIVASTNGAIETTDILIANNTLRNIDAYTGIFAYSNSDFIRDITIEGNMIEMGSTASYGCIETPTYPGTPTRCAIAIQGNSGNPTRDRISVVGNTVTGGILSGDEDNLGSVKIADNTVTGDEGIGITAAGKPLSIVANTITSFQANGIYITGLEDDDRTGSVLVSNNSLIGNNDDATQDQAIMFYSPASPCGTDGVVPGGVVIDGNTIQGSATADSLTNAIQIDVCARAIISNNSIDFLTASHSTGSGIQNGAVITGNRIKSPDLYGIITQVSGGVVSNNLIEASGNRGIFASGANDVTITGNTIHGNVASFAIDASGQRPICLGNISKSDDGSDRTIVCGETAPSGAGCSADGADAGGLCGFNQVCNTGDTGC